MGIHLSQTAKKCALAVALAILLAPAHAGDEKALFKLFLTWNILYRGGDYEAGIPVAKEMLREAEGIKGKNNTYVVASLNMLSQTHVAMGEFDLAEPLFRRAIKEAEGAEDPYDLLVPTLHNLASLYSKMGDNKRAEPLFLRALDLSEEAFGEASREGSGAGEPWREVLGEVLGQSDPDPPTAKILHNLGVTYYELDKHAEAESALSRAMEIREAALGKDHLSTAQTMNQLAIVYHSQDKYARAAELYRRSLSIHKKTAGPVHPDTASVMHNLARNYISESNLYGAKLLSQKALKIREAVLGPEHPDTAASLIVSALIINYEGDYDTAEHMLRRALKIAEATHGPGDARTKEIRQVISLIAEEQER